MTRALVLGGGGPVGIAWEAGLLAGLAEGGVDLGGGGLHPRHLGRLVRRLAAGDGAQGGRHGRRDPGRGRAPAPRPRPASGRRRRERRAARRTSASCSRRCRRRRSGERDRRRCAARSAPFALEAKTIDEASFIGSFGRQLSEPAEDAWPSRGFACTAVDAETGEFVVWNADSKVGLARAVASSCSVPGVYPPITINGRRYIDGGMRSGTNADLATGHDLVVVVGLRTAGDAEMSARMRAPLESEMQVLQDGGARRSS